MICKNCGNELPDGSKACPACGEQFTGKKKGKKKKIIIIVVAVIAVIGIAAALGSGDSESPPVTNDRGETVQANIANSKYGVTIVGSEVTTEDYSGDIILIVEYEFTNNSDTATSFSRTFDHKVFQNGVECPETLYTDNGFDPNAVYNDVKPTTTYKFKNAYTLKNNTDDATVELKSFWGTEKYLEQTIKLK